MAGFTNMMHKGLNNMLWCRQQYGVAGSIKTVFGKSSLVFLALVMMPFAVLAGGSVTLQWNSSTDPSVAGYNIYYGGRSDVYTNKIKLGNVNQVTITGLTPGITYYFAASTYSAAGAESMLSSELAYLVPVPPNQPPTLAPISNLMIGENLGMQTVSLSDITSGSPTENQTLTVTAFSSDTDLIPNPVVSYTSPNTNGSLSFTPAHNANGTAIISVTVNDGQARNNTVTRTFLVTVQSGGGGHPAVINPLTNQVVVAGQTVRFSPTSNGGTVFYQWKFNGTNLPATGPVLQLTNVTIAQAGLYSVTANNNIGITVSSAILTVYSGTATLTPAVHIPGQYAVAITGISNLTYVVEASTNLINWVPVQTNTAPFTFVDTNAARYSRRFYRSYYIP